MGEGPVLARREIGNLTQKANAGHDGAFQVVAARQLGKQAGKPRALREAIADQWGRGHARSLLDNLTQKANAGHIGAFLSRKVIHRIDPTPLLTPPPNLLV